MEEEHTSDSTIKSAIKWIKVFNRCIIFNYMYLTDLLEATIQLFNNPKFKLNTN